MLRVIFSVFLGIVDEVEEEIEIDEYSSESDSSSESSIGEMQYVRDMEAEEKEEEMKAQLATTFEEEVPERAFDMKKNLERIGCARFYEDLMAEGFVDEVCIIDLWFKLFFLAV